MFVWKSVSCFSIIVQLGFWFFTVHLISQSMILNSNITTQFCDIFIFVFCFYEHSQLWFVFLWMFSVQSASTKPLSGLALTDSGCLQVCTVVAGWTQFPSIWQRMFALCFGSGRAWHFGVQITGIYHIVWNAHFFQKYPF